MRRTWSACGGIAAGCTGPGRSRPPSAVSISSCRVAASTGHEGQGHDKLIFEGRLQAASVEAERRSGAEPAGPRVQRLPAAHPSGLRPDLREGRQFMGVHPPAHRSGQPRDRRSFGGYQTRPVFCQVGVGRFGVSFGPFERLVLGRLGVGRSCRWLLWSIA